MDENTSEETYTKIICRFCLRIVDKAMSLREPFSDKDYKISLYTAIADVVPEINLDVVINPKICSKCCGLLTSSFAFRKRCFQSERKIMTFTIEKSSPSVLSEDYLSILHREFNLHRLSNVSNKEEQPNGKQMNTRCRRYEGNSSSSEETAMKEKRLPEKTLLNDHLRTQLNNARFSLGLYDECSSIESINIEEIQLEWPDARNKVKNGVILEEAVSITDKQDKCLKIPAGSTVRSAEKLGNVSSSVLNKNVSSILNDSPEENSLYICKLCNKFPYLPFEKAWEHFQYHFILAKMLKCPLCARTFSYETTKEHMVGCNVFEQFKNDIFEQFDKFENFDRVKRCKRKYSAIQFIKNRKLFEIDHKTAENLNFLQNADKISQNQSENSSLNRINVKNFNTVLENQPVVNLTEENDEEVQLCKVFESEEEGEAVCSIETELDENVPNSIEETDLEHMENSKNNGNIVKEAFLTFSSPQKVINVNKSSENVQNWPVVDLTNTIDTEIQVNKEFDQGNRKLNTGCSLKSDLSLTKLEIPKISIKEPVPRRKYILHFNKDNKEKLKKVPNKEEKTFIEKEKISPLEIVQNDIDTLDKVSDSGNVQNIQTQQNVNKLTIVKFKQKPNKKQDEAGLSSGNPSNLLEKETLISELSFKCHFCPKTQLLHSLKRFKEHLMEHIKNINYVTCQYCSGSFEREYFHDHLGECILNNFRECSEEAQTYICNICMHNWKSLYDFKVHVQNHIRLNVISNYKFTCPLCELPNLNLRDHWKTCEYQIHQEPPNARPICFPVSDRELKLYSDRKVAKIINILKKYSGKDNPILFIEKRPEKTGLKDLKTRIGPKLGKEDENKKNVPSISSVVTSDKLLEQSLTKDFDFVDMNTFMNENDGTQQRIQSVTDEMETNNPTMIECSSRVVKIEPSDSEEEQLKISETYQGSKEDFLPTDEEIKIENHELDYKPNFESNRLEKMFALEFGDLCKYSNEGFFNENKMECTMNDVRFVKTEESQISDREPRKITKSDVSVIQINNDQVAKNAKIDQAKQEGKLMYQCHFCMLPLAFKSREHLKCHLRQHMTWRKKLTCPCGKVVQKTNFAEHYSNCKAVKTVLVTSKIE